MDYNSINIETTYSHCSIVPSYLNTYLNILLYYIYKFPEILFILHVVILLSFITTTICTTLHFEESVILLIIIN